MRVERPIFPQRHPHNPKACPWVWLCGLFCLVATSAWGEEVEPDRLRRTGLDGGYVQLDLHSSILSDIPSQAMLAISIGYGARGGYRWSGVGCFLSLEHNLWLGTELNTTVVEGAVNIGVGVEYLYADGFVRSSLAVGPSILAWNTVLDSAGSVGIFLDLRPAGLRWVVHDHVALLLDPLSFSLVAPVLGGIPLIRVQYRTTFTVEALF